MPALRYDIVVEQGADFRLALRWLSPDGTPVDLTGYAAASQVRLNHGALAVLLDFTSDSSSSDPTRIVLGGQTGTVVLEADADATRVLAFRHAVYDIEVTAPDGAVHRLAEGRVTLSREVTA